MSQDAGECQQPPPKRTRSHNTITRDAAAAARFLCALGHGQLSLHRRAITYHTVEPHVAALLRWLGTLESDVAIHLQLPPALASLRAILNAILDQQVSTATWAAMIEVGESLDKLASGGNLAHPADTPAQDAGRLNTNLVAEVASQAPEPGKADGGDPDRSAHRRGPTTTGRLAGRTGSSDGTEGEQIQNQHGADGGEAAMWWTLDRHHGLGDQATSRRSPSHEQESLDSGGEPQAQTLAGDSRKGTLLSWKLRGTTTPSSPTTPCRSGCSSSENPQQAVLNGE